MAIKHFTNSMSASSIALALILGLASSRTLATEGGSIHWAYAAFFGTGQYELADADTVTVLRPTARFELREALIDPEGHRQLGWRARVPVAIGLHRFDVDDPDTSLLDVDNVGSISAVPGVEFDYPVSGRWLLRTSAHLGWGSLSDGSESAWTYWAQVGSRYSWDTGPVRWSLLSSVGFAGYTPNEDRIESMFPLMGGFEWEYPFKRWTWGNDPMRLTWHAMYTYFLNDLDVVVQQQTIASLTDKWQAGMAIGKLNKKMDIFGFKLDRIGVAVERGGDNLTGVKIYFRSIFDF